MTATTTAPPAGSTRVGYEVANALGRLYQVRPGLAARCDDITSYAKVVRSYLNDLDLYCQHYGTSPSELRIDTRLEVEQAQVIQTVREHTHGVMRPLGEYGMRDPVAFLLRRIKRLADLLDHQPVLDGAQDLASAMDSWCAIHQLNPHYVTPSAIASGGMRYIVHTLEYDGR